MGKAHGVKLGFMSFFVKAATEALKRFPAVNASLDGNDMVYHGYQDVGVAVSTERGLVVPILRDTDSMGLAEIESTIGDFAKRGRDGKLGIEDMQGGTFTITNGGIFGSLMSTPILNPPRYHGYAQDSGTPNGSKWSGCYPANDVPRTVL